MAKTAQQLKEENAIQNRIAQGIAEIRIATIEQHIASYKQQMLTASEFLGLTDNLLQDELKQALGR